MLKRDITYKDFFTDQMVTEEFYFNLTEAELIEFEVDYEGGFQAAIMAVIRAEDQKTLVAEFKKIILLSYGIRVGNNFEKSDQIRDQFTSTAAYSELFMELATDSAAAAVFMNGIIPTVEKTDQDKPVGPPPSPMAPPAPTA